MLSMSRLLEKPGPSVDSPERVEEGVFCELRHDGVLSSSLVSSNNSTNTLIIRIGADHREMTLV